MHIAKIPQTLAETTIYYYLCKVMMIERGRQAPLFYNTHKRKSYHTT